MCSVTIASAQVKFTVIPSKTVVGQHETFQIQFVVEGATEVDEFKPPAFRNFEQLSGLDQSTGWTWVNGSLSEYVSYTDPVTAAIETHNLIKDSCDAIVALTNMAIKADRRLADALPGLAANIGGK